MKNKIFMYLFIFTLLLVVFQYVNSKNILEAYNVKYEKCLEIKESNKDEIAVLEDKVSNLEDQILDLSEFKLDQTEAAMSYFEARGFNISELIPFIKDEIYELNALPGEEHALIPYASMSGGKMLINSIRLLNHKWIIANFSDGKYWGELLINYEITEDEQLNFKLIDSFLYPTQ
ncbi:hydrolase [Xanthomarina sp. F1114]|uniref:hydrolase n=1 Tax=Xanthomarina sp. F1114 TaxID=2996019 RepID=UPI00225E1EE1|nr:hydrolase [Xanthomarina sp. F1114]MCX7547346.1 hydrolase [Xanthomarina sp. F1114]